MSASVRLRPRLTRRDAIPRAPRGRRTRAALAAAGVAVLGGAAWLSLASGDGGGDTAVSDRVPTTTFVVTRRDLVDREDVEGKLTYADRRTIVAGMQGTLTRVRPEGTTVVRGQSLYSVDATATAYLMYGRIPQYRALQSGVSNGGDVRQLESNLAALGYDPAQAMRVDGHWDAATTAAVKRWQLDRGVERTGVVELGEVVFADGPLRIGKHDAAVGDAVREGAPVTTVTSRRRVIVARLATSRQSLVRVGQRVRVTLPDGRVVAGRITHVGRVAEAGEDGAEATVELRVALVGRGARRARLDQAPVTVSIATSAAKRVLAVPVTALVALRGGRYGVEVVRGDGGRRIVPVTLGAFADGYVEVTGISEGTRVVVPR